MKDDPEDLLPAELRRKTQKEFQSLFLRHPVVCGPKKSFYELCQCAFFAKSVFNCAHLWRGSRWHKIKVNQAWSRWIKVNQAILKHFFYALR
jgi:hypothetical protein